MSDPREPPKPGLDALLDRGAGQPPEIRAPLARFKGARPSAPAWFEEALAQAPERSLVETPRGRIETLCWGERGKPGLLFVHGNRAHADWWTFIAPFFAEDYRVAALSLAGMGESDWRAFYAGEGHVDDLDAVARAAGLHDGGRKPIYIGHSFGGGVVFQAAALRPERLHAAILIDVGLTGRTAERIIADSQRRMAETSAGAGAQGPRRNAVYATLADALAHFRLSPPQPLENLFIVDYIARRALKRAPLPDGGEGWTWKFDPDLWEKLDRDVMTRLQATGAAVELPMAHVYGDKSPFRPEKGRPGVFPAHTIEIGVPEAHHHVPIDQPLALVAALRALLAAWRA